MKKQILTLLLTLALPINAITLVKPKNSIVEVNYDDGIENQIIQITYFPFWKIPANKSAPLYVRLNNIASNVHKTRLNGDNYSINYYLYPVSYEADVVNGSSMHKLIIAGLRNENSLGKLDLEFLDENDQIIETKPLRFNLTNRTRVNKKNNGCVAVVECGRFDYPDEESFYHEFTYACDRGGAIKVESSLCPQE